MLCSEDPKASCIRGSGIFLFAICLFVRGLSSHYNQQPAVSADLLVVPGSLSRPPEEPETRCGFPLLLRILLQIVNQVHRKRKGRLLRAAREMEDEWLRTLREWQYDANPAKAGRMMALDLISHLTLRQHVIRCLLFDAIFLFGVISGSFSVVLRIPLRHVNNNNNATSVLRTSSLAAAPYVRIYLANDALRSAITRNLSRLFLPKLRSYASTSLEMVV